MIRLIQIALLLAIVIPLGMAKAQAPNTEAAARKLRGDWEGCVRLSAQLWSPTGASDLLGPAEAAFRSCATEEQLIVIYAQVIAPERWPVLLAPFYKSKSDLKQKINDEHFKSIANRIGKQ